MNKIQIGIDVKNLRFYAAMASDFQWKTDVIDHRVIEATLNEIADRILMMANQVEELNRKWEFR